MIVLQHGRHTERALRRVYTCKRCRCVYMPDEQEETRTPDGKDYAAECPDCGKLGRNYIVEERTVLQIEGPALREYYGG